MNIYIAKQPIFNRKREVVFYELLFRASKDNIYSAVDGDDATYEVIANTFLSMGIEKITGNKKAFINFTEKLILNETAMLLPKEYLGVELLEDISPSLEIVQACKKLKGNGYLIVLDDFEFREEYRELVNIADIIKIDFMAASNEDRKNVIKKFGNKNTKFLAEKVETLEEYKEAIDIGYDYFQGYFFSKPEVISERDIPVNTKMKYELLKVAFDENTRIQTLESIIKRDVSLSYKLMKLINSAYFGFKKKITSIREAIIIMGMKEIQKWMFLITIKNECNGIFDEILNRSIVRARLGELISDRNGLEKIREKIFLMEIFSETDVILSRSLEDIMEGLALDDEIKRALLGENNDLGIIHELLCSYQNAEWEKFEIYSKMIDIRGMDISELYFEAIEWSQEILG